VGAAEVEAAAVGAIPIAVRGAPDVPNRAGAAAG